MLALPLIFLASCRDLKKEIDAAMWSGDHTEQIIKRDVKCTKEAEQNGWCRIDCKGDKDCSEVYEQILPTDHPTFDRMRCFIEKDLNNIIDAAMRSCRRN